MCQAIQTLPIQPQLEQNAKARKPHNHATSPNLPQVPTTACQTLRKGLYLLSLVGLCWAEFDLAGVERGSSCCELADVVPGEHTDLGGSRRLACHRH